MLTTRSDVVAELLYSLSKWNKQRYYESVIDATNTYRSGFRVDRDDIANVLKSYRGRFKQPSNDVQNVICLRYRIIVRHTLHTNHLKNIQFYYLN